MPAEDGKNYETDCVNVEQIILTPLEIVLNFFQITPTSEENRSIKKLDK